MPDTRKRRSRNAPPPTLDVPLVCRECGKPTSAREGLVCDNCYFRLIQDCDSLPEPAMYDKTIHPDPVVAAECEIERLQGLLFDARCGLFRALEFRAGTPQGTAIRRDVRSALERTGGLSAP